VIVKMSSHLNYQKRSAKSLIDNLMNKTSPPNIKDERCRTFNQVKCNLNIKNEFTVNAFNENNDINRCRFPPPLILKPSCENLANNDYTVETINAKRMKHTNVEESNNQYSLIESMLYFDLLTCDKSFNSQRMINAAGDIEAQVKLLPDIKKKNPKSKKSPKDVNLVERNSTNSCTNMSAENAVNSNARNNLNDIKNSKSTANNNYKRMPDNIYKSKFYYRM